MSCDPGHRFLGSPCFIFTLILNNYQISLILFGKPLIQIISLQLTLKKLQL